MRRAPPIEFSAEERAELQRTARSMRSSVRDVFRACLILLAADGMESRDIAGKCIPGRLRCRGGEDVSPKSAWLDSLTDRDQSESGATMKHWWSAS